jgi:hypothetical protein
MPRARFASSPSPRSASIDHCDSHYETNFACILIAPCDVTTDSLPDVYAVTFEHFQRLGDIQWTRSNLLVESGEHLSRQGDLLPTTTLSC